MDNPVLEMRAVTKTFGELVAVNNLTLRINPGEIYGLIGPNGSGKTTTLNMITGLYRPSSGIITVSGYDVQKKSTGARKHVGFVPDNPSAYDQLTGREFLRFVGELYSLERTEREQKINDLLEQYEISDLANGLYGNYSRGTKQKISLIAALLHEPSLLLIDEPMVGLDPSSARITLHLLRQFADRGGAVMVSAHTLPVAEELCTRFGVLAAGQLVGEGERSILLRQARLEEGSLEDIYVALTAGI
jgi:ABC-2 type transport system ATP-binding protein